MPLPTIVTDRLVLRAPAPADLARFLAYRNHPDNLRYQAVAPVDDAAAAAFLARQAALDLDAGPCWVMAALALRDSGSMIGEVGVWLGPARERSGDIGWSVHPAQQGQGYAVEAARALLGYLFTARVLHRVTATSDQRNAASTRVMERLGMRREGAMRQSRYAHGAWRDEYVYAVLREEWLAA